MKLKHKLWVFGSVKHLIRFIYDNYESDPYHQETDGNGHPNFLLHFRNLCPVPEELLEEGDKERINEWKKENWGSGNPFYDQWSELILYYKHSYDYTTYKLSYDDRFNAYAIDRLLYEVNGIFNDNMNPDENELITSFYTDAIPLAMFKKWIIRYQFTTLKIRLDYWDCEDDSFVGKLYYDYEHDMYLCDHHVKKDNPVEYIHYLLNEGLRSIDGFAEEIVDCMIEKDPKLKESNRKDLVESVLDIIEDEKNVELIDVAKSIHEVLSSIE